MMSRVWRHSFAKGYNEASSFFQDALSLAVKPQTTSAEVNETLMPRMVRSFSKVSFPWIIFLVANLRRTAMRSCAGRASVYSKRLPALFSHRAIHRHSRHDRSRKRYAAKPWTITSKREWNQPGKYYLTGLPGLPTAPRKSVRWFDLHNVPS